MTASAGPALKRLYAEFGDRVAFLTLYVREAHPDAQRHGGHVRDPRFCWKACPAGRGARSAPDVCHRPPGRALPPAAITITLAGMLVLITSLRRLVAHES